jgi:hypothetical protein
VPSFRRESLHSASTGDAAPASTSRNKDMKWASAAMLCRAGHMRADAHASSSAFFSRCGFASPSDLDFTMLICLYMVSARFRSQGHSNKWEILIKSLLL